MPGAGVVHQRIEGACVVWSSWGSVHGDLVVVGGKHGTLYRLASAALKVGQSSALM